ncbi:nephrin-like isoform X2 [Planococcus citri]|uniref:nephrin-like isoform X2 n=1 Tax=Planococcus citri TaxID=170843 RepID=UPI0031F829D1
MLVPYFKSVFSSNIFLKDEKKVPVCTYGFEFVSELLQDDLYTGNPKPKLTWWRGLDQLDYTYEEDEDVVKNTLWIDNLQRENMNDILTCKAENSNLTKPVYFNVSINLHVGAQEIRFMTENKEMSAGHQYAVVCKAKGSRPPANITWWKDSIQLKPPTPIRYSVDPDFTATSVLTFTPEGTDSGKTLSCEASNVFVPQEKRKDFWTLKVNYAPIISLNFGKNINSSAIQENEDVYLECNIKADPWITRIRWLHNNKQITSNPAYGIIISNQTLVLQQVTKNSSGYYRCAALNSEGESVSQSVKLDVKYEPVCRMNQQRVYGAERNEEINITCQVDGNPTPTWFRWSFNNSMVHIVSVNNFVNHNGSSVIAYKPISESSYGTLLCSSQNELGPQVVPCVFHVVSAGKPDPPHNCSVVNKTESWLYVKCLRGFDGGLPQEFICEVTQEWNDKVISNITSKTEPEFRITGLEHRTAYRVVIYAANVKGKSKEYILLNVTTAPEAKTQRRRSTDHSDSFLKTHLIPKIIIAAATVLLIVILVVGLITRIMVRKRRRKRSSSEELRKAQLSQGSLSHSEDDKNPDLIPQSTITGISCPILNSISVQTASSDSDISILPVREKAMMGSKIPTLLEANRLEELVWPASKWSTTIEPIMLVLPETMSIVPKQNAETQTPSSPQNRKESAV